MNTLSQIQCPKKALRKITSIIKHNFSHIFCLKWDFIILKHKQHLIFFFILSFATFNLRFQSHWRSHGFVPKNRQEISNFSYFHYSASSFVCSPRKINVCSAILSFFCKVAVLIDTCFFQCLVGNLCYMSVCKMLWHFWEKHQSL